MITYEGVVIGVSAWPIVGQYEITIIVWDLGSKPLKLPLYGMVEARALAVQLGKKIKMTYKNGRVIEWEPIPDPT